MLRYGAWNEMIGRTVAEVLPEAAAKIITEALEQVTSTGQAETLSYSISTPSGTSYRETSFALVGDPSSSESSVVALVRDVTERVSLQDQLLQSQKLEAVGRLAGGIAHDFNNILQVILGFCDLLSDHSETQEKALNDVAVIRDAASRAASLTAQLLTFSRNEAQNLKALDVCAVAQVMSPMLQRALGEDIALQVACPSTPLWIEADEGQFLQILMNLAVNARDAMPNGGSLRIEIDEASASRLRNIAAVSGDHVRISVADRGTGMTEEVMDHIFEPFYTTKEVGRGTGLGLSIVYSIMKQFHGHISVQSELEKGTRFDLYFPRVSHTLSSETHALTPTSDSRGSETVLVIEDEAPVRSLVQRVLKSKGYAVLVASNGKEGLATLGRQKGRIDLLLTDMVMPRHEGGRGCGGVQETEPLRACDNHERLFSARASLGQGESCRLLSAQAVQDRRVAFVHSKGPSTRSSATEQGPSVLSGVAAQLTARRRCFGGPIPEVAIHRRDEKHPDVVLSSAWPITTQSTSARHGSGQSSSSIPCESFFTLPGRSSGRTFGEE